MSAISDGPIDIPQQLQPKSHDVMVISHGMAFRHLSTGFGNEASKGDREVSERTYPLGHPVRTRTPDGPFALTRRSDHPCGVSYRSTPMTCAANAGSPDCEPTPPCLTASHRRVKSAIRGGVHSSQDSRPPPPDPRYPADRIRWLIS